MAYYSLKDEKRINVNGEWDKVVTHPNNEPIFRQNGHELKFDSANSDWLNIPSAEVDSFRFVVKVNSYTSQLSILGDNSGNDLLGLYETGEIGIQDGSSNFEFLNFGFNPFELIDVSGVWNGSQYDVTLNDSTLTTSGLASKINFNRLFRRFSTFYFDGEVRRFELNGEAFDPIDIDSSGQIEGSSGTVATVNTSHASGLSYILGTVFQKSSFALAFDSANSEYADVDYLTNWVNLSDANFKVKFEIFGQSTDTRIIYCDGIFNNSAAGMVRLLINPNSYTLVVVCTSKINGNFEGHFEGLGGAGTYEVGLNGLDLVVNGQTVFTFTEKAIDLTNSSYKPTISKSSYVDSFYSDFRYYGLEIDGITYPLTEGLGNTTNGANINTSHADGIERINYGMWLKGNDTDGWTPYVKQ
jgi:hypothetical protein